MAHQWCLFLGLTSLVWQVFCNPHYTNYLLIKVIPQTEEQLAAVNTFKDPLKQVEVMKHSHGIKDSMDLLVPPDRLRYVEEFATSMMLVIKSTDYGKVLTEAAKQIPSRRSMRGFDVFTYMSYETIMSYIDTLPQRYPDLVTVEDRGESYEGRPMKLVKISSNPKARYPVIFVDAGIHSREWVAPAMAMYLINRLVSEPESRRRELNGVDWYILPLVNPDGYEYSRSHPNARMWRKTRSRHMKSDVCIGVDGNRNFGFRWATSGVSHNPCDRETYAGPKPFSEPETQIVRDIMMDYRNKIKLYVSLHAYGNYLVYPWGYTADIVPATWKQLDWLAQDVSKAVVKAGGRPFHVLSAGRWYAAAGGSDDYAFGVVGIPYSYTMELTDGYEFIYPESRLRILLPQIYQGFVTFASRIRSQFGPQDDTGDSGQFDNGPILADQVWLQRYKKKLSSQ